MTSTKLEMSDQTSLGSITTLYAEGRGQGKIDSSCSVRKRDSYMTHKPRNVDRSTTKVPLTRNSKPKVIRSERVFIAKTTKTYEMRRKAIEAKTKEWAEKKKDVHQVSSRPTIKTTVFPVEREKKTTTWKAATSKTANANISKRRPISNMSSTRSTAGSSPAMKRLRDILYPAEKLTPRMKNAEVQTCKSEIVNNMLMIGDSKIMHPSPDIWGEILKKREADLKQAMLKEVRKVPEHSRHEVNYQTNLKEFLETGTVKHYEREAADSKLTDAHSEQFRRPFRKPRSPPEMDLTKRISIIERELMGVYKGGRT